jgi:hypothetical protein
MLIEVEKARAIVAAANRVERLTALVTAWKAAEINGINMTPNLIQETVAVLGVEPKALGAEVKGLFVKRLEALVAQAQTALDVERNIPG